ncbi:MULTISPECIES: hypothetical protein [Bacteroidaceae]|uniref:hypothetical protein n=1 Tax=Bacteroidaceae TaxID=815 RepID=UPI001F36D878|nr:MULTISPECIES: hypothetical protein [Bacteroides]MDT4441850.1 hypothetical protein [Bacteroides uniformis]
MERQTKITKEISMLENKDALLYSVIKMNSNYYNGYSEIAETKLSKLSGIPISTIKKHRPQLLKTGIFSSWNYFKDELGHNRIRYQMEINPENYFILKNTFFSDSKLSEEEKGFILKLKTITVNNTNIIPYNKTKIKSLLKIGKNNELIKTLIEKGYILKFEIDKYYLNCNDILFSSNEEREKVYRMIEKMCLNREIIPPPFEKNKLDKIKNKSPLLKLEEQLNKRCSEFKNGGLYEYIFKCFNITQKQPVKNTYDEAYIIL